MGKYLTLSTVFYLIGLLVSVYLGVNLYTTLSFKVDDIPWTPIGTTISPIVGPHYFGDFSLMMAYLQLEDPYQKDLLIAFGQPATAYFLFKPLTLLPFKLAFFAILLIGLGMTYTAMVSLAKLCGIKIRNSFIFFILGTSYPLLMAVDRGNFVFIGMSALVLYTVRILSNEQKKSKFFITAILGIVAISIKIYFIIPIILIILLARKFRQGIYLVTAFILSNLFFSQFFPGKINSVINSILSYVSLQSGDGFLGSSWILGGVSPNKSFIRIWSSFFRQSDEVTVQSYVKILPIYMFCVILAMTIIIVRIKFPVELKILICLMTSQTIPSTAMGYTMVWAPFGLILGLSLLVSYNNKIRSSLLLISIAVLNLPNTYSYFVPGTFNNWQLQCSTLCILVVLILLTWKTRDKVAYGRKAKV